METDLLGHEILLGRVGHGGANKWGRNANPNGYPSHPGSGPAGETCKTCAHYRRVQHGAGIYRKCAKLEHCWTHGQGPDIKASAAACKFWEKQQ